LSEIDISADHIIHTGKKLYDAGYIRNSEGNLSVRLSDNRILITPAGLCKAELVPEDLVVCDLSGKVLKGSRKPSSELKLHLTVYGIRSDVSVVCHTHPNRATHYAHEMINFDNFGVSNGAGKIRMIPYAPPGSAELAAIFGKNLKNNNIFLLQKHGLVVLAKTCDEAFELTEAVESLFDNLYIAGMSAQIKSDLKSEDERNHK